MGGGIFPLPDPVVLQVNYRFGKGGGKGFRELYLGFCHNLNYVQLSVIVKCIQVKLCGNEFMT